MSTTHIPSETPAPTPLALASAGRLLTAADLAALPMQLPTGPVDYELDNGRLIVMSPPGHRHASLQTRIASLFVTYGEEAGLGRAFTDVGVVLRRNPDRVVSPDVAFVCQAHLPLEESPEGYLATIPDLVVEIRSKNDSAEEMTEKTCDYLKAGVGVVWVVDPQARTIVVTAADGESHTLGEQDTLRAGGIMPCFERSVAKLFAE